MPINKDPTTPPPMIGKIGPYTVFMTPPSTPKPAEPVFDSPKKVATPPPVQPPPQQFEKSVSVQSVPNGSVVGFFKNAVCKVQNGMSFSGLMWYFHVVFLAVDLCVLSVALIFIFGWKFLSLSLVMGFGISFAVWLLRKWLKIMEMSVEEDKWGDGSF